jgi:uncharacterized protein YjiS (DUF1127 family)
MNALTHDLRVAAATARNGEPATTGWNVRANARDRFLSLEKILHALACWWHVRREIGRLSSYPDRMLKDIGVSRGGIPGAIRHGR